MLKITNGKVITAEKIVSADVYVEGGVIVAVTSEALPFDEVIDAEGNYISPGFIDTHVHGGVLCDFGDEDDESIFKIMNAHFKHGTTTIMPTICSRKLPTLDSRMERIKRVSARDAVPHVPGVHLEGPYLAVAQSGGIDPECMSAPVKEEYEPFFDKYGDFIAKMTFAPELEGAVELFESMKAHGILPTVGHTDATVEEIEKYHDMGLTMFTHLYSSMSTITRRDGYRILGVIESAYYYGDMYTEVICDGIHLPPKLLEMIYRLRGSDKICLITDAIRGAEVPDELLPVLREKYNCVIEDGIGKMPGKNCFAGSVATTDRLIREMRPISGLTEAVKMLTKTPAIAHGLKGKGEIKVGYDADIVIFDEGINVKKIIMKNGDGVRVY